MAVYVPSPRGPSIIVLLTNHLTQLISLRDSRRGHWAVGTRPSASPRYEATGTSGTERSAEAWQPRHSSMPLAPFLETLGTPPHHHQSSMPSTLLHGPAFDTSPSPPMRLLGGDRLAMRRRIRVRGDINRGCGKRPNWGDLWCQDRRWCILSGLIF